MSLLSLLCLAWTLEHVSGGTFFAAVARVLSAPFYIRMQSASCGRSLDLCMQAGLAYCILLTLDRTIIPGVVIICGLVIISGVVIIHDLD